MMEQQIIVLMNMNSSIIMTMEQVGFKEYANQEKNNLR